jgi:branched-subunit amino acid aminotransferase/4-amino-4-deoxychorismate lyase
MTTPRVYLNGRILPLPDAAISPLDIGLLRGYACFDLLRTVGGRPYLLAEHLRRLRHSAEQLGLDVPATDAEIASAIDELLALNGHAEATVRLVLTGGISADGMGFDPTTPTFLILTHELHEPPASLFEQGGALLLTHHRRELPQAKTTNYITMLRHRGAAAEAGAMDLLYHDGERVFEAASASVYFVRDGQIFAPVDDVLWGTVGSRVLAHGRARHEVVLGEVSLEDALCADEVFLTSTTRGVVPIVRLGDQQVGDGAPGPVTRDLMTVWQEVLATEQKEGFAPTEG